MKRAFITLLIFLTAVYARQGYDFLTADGTNICRLTGELSEIAEEVIAIPLQKSKEYRIRNARQVRKVGDHLFLLCNETLYRFTKEGQFAGAITSPENIRVGGYIIDNRKQTLIVLGNEDDIHYYTFDGELLETKKLKSDITRQRVYSMAMHKDSIWTTEQCLSHDPDTNLPRMEVVAVRYDSSFRKLESRRIVSAETGRDNSLEKCFGGEFCVRKDTGGIYLYNPPLSMENLFNDTLYLIHNHSGFERPDYITSYPLRMGSRFWLTACRQDNTSTHDTLFCYDTLRNRSWQLADGFNDDFYGTGNITGLHSMDIYNQEYYFCKSAQEIAGPSLPHTGEDNLVVFVVKLKV